MQKILYSHTKDIFCRYAHEICTMEHRNTKEWLTTYYISHSRVGVTSKRLDATKKTDPTIRVEIGLVQT